MSTERTGAGVSETLRAELQAVVRDFSNAFQAGTGRYLCSEATLEEFAERIAVLAVQAQWQPIETAPKDRLIIGALIRDGVLWRVHEMKHNGLAFYTKAGGALPQMTHWMPLPLIDPPQAERPPEETR